MLPQDDNKNNSNTVLKRKKTQALHQASLPFGQMKLITSSTLLFPQITFT